MSLLDSHSQWCFVERIKMENRALGLAVLNGEGISKRVEDLPKSNLKISDLYSSTQRTFTVPTLPAAEQGPIAYRIQAQVRAQTLGNVTPSGGASRPRSSASAPSLHGGASRDSRRSSTRALSAASSVLLRQKVEDAVRKELSLALSGASTPASRGGLSALSIRA
eukprot:TRINITY_DN121947_c0_g1_i1.p1 TRINITY_DN121947_c0_g1~~TRINITY_DN121947_c0_g1_i1.p1  ORF type:complete len:189 (-),score=33.02 TRINITY_DN121947_c0_g1_i1:64-558(-)